MVQDFLGSVSNFISSIKTQLRRKHILHLLPFKPQHDSTNKMTCAPSEVSVQAGHPHSMIRAFAVRMKNPCIPGYPLSAQRAKTLIRLGDAQADLSLRWAHKLVGCAMLRLMYIHLISLEIIMFHYVYCRYQIPDTVYTGNLDVY